MTLKIRRQSRRSLSIFSLDHIRSLSRSSVHPVQLRSPNASLRSPSSLSCNPYAQTPASPEPNAAVSKVVAEGLIHSPAGNESTRMALSHLRLQDLQDGKEIKPRPRSWFSVSRSSFRARPTRSHSVQLPKDASFSTVGRSIISAPVLTATTNMSVAEVEGVCCRDIVDAGLTTHTEESKARTDSSAANVISSDHVEHNGLRRFRLPNARRNRQEKTRSLVLDITHGCSSEQASEDTWQFSNIEKGLSRRRAETINLCREKINKLTGHGRIRRKSVNKGNLNTLDTNDNIGNDDIIAQPEVFKVNTIEGEFLTLNHSKPDLAFGSLTRSFASAIDKLDFHSSPVLSNMEFIKSKSSIFSLRKRSKHAESVDLNKEEVEQQRPATIQRPKLTKKDNINCVDTGLTMIEALKLNPILQTHRSEVHTSHPEPLQFSAAANNYVPAEPTACYPKGVKVLGTHSNPMEFATAPSWVTDLPKPPTHTPTLEEVTVPEDEEEDDAIQDAPIYSPSSGDLSQYQRSTPLSAQLTVGSHRCPEPETPTGVHTDKSYMRRLGLRKSKSGLGLLSRFNRGQKEVKEEASPFQARNNNQKTAQFQYLKKSRSMNLAALLRKGESASIKEPLLRKEPDVQSQSQSQPMKPSPLRYQEQVDDIPAAQSQTIYGAQRRTPPRGNITPSDRAKRMGIIGMPQEGGLEHVDGRRSNNA